MIAPIDRSSLSYFLTPDLLLSSRWWRLFVESPFPFSLFPLSFALTPPPRATHNKANRRQHTHSPTLLASPIPSLMSRPESVPAMPSLLLEPSAAYTDTDTDLHPSSTIVAGVYQVGGVIGVGTYGEVRYAVSLLTGDRVALKIVDLARFSLETAGIMRKEITILRMLHHPHCIRIIDVHENVPFTGKW